ncbi:unnamed protein product [Spodoptera littoralis]|uniref:ZAD domain-containing protein n=1 Tax=Spodoptera littoralis TaxID=7109 RepID=A0A9P0I2V3_SPOLI|nr:unnamed protein product [Spodoptera littoralis]CAH1639015.1 unnamed protein product [Spodoptera littoralis]
MEEPEDISNMDGEPFNMEACRICLATDVKMYSLSDPYLAGCIKEIGLNNESPQWMPKFICYECRPTLIKCNKLIENSKVVQDILSGLHSNSQVITKETIREQQGLHINLQSSLKFSFLQRQLYITHDDANSASNDDTTSVPKLPLRRVRRDSRQISANEILAQYVPMRLVSPIIDSGSTSPPESQDGQTLPEEIADDKENDEAGFEDEWPFEEIYSDEEETADDPKPDSNADDGLMYFDVNTKARRSKSFVADQSSPIYAKKRMALSDIQIPKSRKKKKKKHKSREEKEDEDCVKRTFRIERVKTKGRTEKKYTCKYCTKTYSYGDEAKDHYLLGCPQRHSPRSSTPSSGVRTWQDWTGSS